MQTVEAYPGDAIGGADFFTGAAQRTIVAIDPGGREVTRREKIVVTDRYFDGEQVAPIGRACLSEQTIRTLGGMIGLYDAVFVANLERQARVDRARIEALQGEVMRLKALVASWDDTESVREVFVTDDGATHPTRLAAIEHVTTPAPITPTPVQPYQEA